MSFILLIACLLPTVEVTTEPEPASKEPEPTISEPEPAPPRMPPGQYDSLLCPDGRYAVGGWVSGLNQPDLVLKEALTVPMRTDFCAPTAATHCTLAPQTFTPGGYTGMENLVTLVHVPPGRVKIHWVGEGGCLLWQDGQSVLDIENCPENPPDLEWVPDASLLPATCTDGRTGWIWEADLLAAGVVQ